MNQAMKTAVCLAISVLFSLAPPGRRMEAAAQEASPADRVVEVLKGLDPGTQERAILQARQRLGVDASPILRACEETLSGYLMNALRSGAVADLETLKAKAREQCASIVRMADRDATAKLSDGDRGFADGLAEAVFHRLRTPAPALPIRLARLREPSAGAPQNVGAPGGINPQNIGAPGGVRPQNVTPPPPAPGNPAGGSQPGANQPSTTTTNPATPPPGAATTPSSAPVPAVLQLGNNKAQLKDAISEQDAGDVKAFLDSTRGKQLPTPEWRDSALRQWLHSPAVPGFESVSFPATFNRITGQNISDYTQLAQSDKDAIEDIIKEVIGGSGTSLTSPTRQDTQAPGAVAGQLAADAADIAGELFVPGYSRIEPLADELIEGAVPLLLRWRPFQRCFGRRVIGTDGALSTRSVGGGYIIVDE